MARHGLKRSLNPTEQNTLTQMNFGLIIEESEDEESSKHEMKKRKKGPKKERTKSWRQSTLTQLDFIHFDQTQITDPIHPLHPLQGTDVIPNSSVDKTLIVDPPATPKRSFPEYIPSSYTPFTTPVSIHHGDHTRHSKTLALESPTPKSRFKFLPSELSKDTTSCSSIGNNHNLYQHVSEVAKGEQDDSQESQDELQDVTNGSSDELTDAPHESDYNINHEIRSGTEESYKMPMSNPPRASQATTIPCTPTPIRKESQDGQNQRFLTQFPIKPLSYSQKAQDLTEEEGEESDDDDMDDDIQDEVQNQDGNNDCNQKENTGPTSISQLIPSSLLNHDIPLPPLWD